jgi:hypothetical protein
VSNRQRNAHGTTQEWVVIRGTKCVKNQTKLSFDFLLYRDQYNGLTLRFQSLLRSFLLHFSLLREKSGFGSTFSKGGKGGL